MKNKQLKGRCFFCKKNFGRNALKGHIEKCEKRKEYIEKSEGKITKNREEIYLVQIKAGAYFMLIEISGNKKVKNLDDFIRGIWVECCGHLSAFSIDGVEYFSSSYERGDRSMNVKIADVLDAGTKFSYEYDFGTTTEIVLEIISIREGKIDKGLLILARNLPPEIKCSVCGKDATEVCSMCIVEDPENSFFCEEHGTEHECGEDMLLPVTNSPRIGMCAYTGDEDEFYEKKFSPKI
ncbi:MAG: plasmid pRiA4b ORF-3 family protein [Candidatus Altiarchaeum hamiconexum]|uniref:Plasmid pRiA4b ORF-3 family protein n=1 Tax=Candidatus Altarchaeum hamiconexum TaxID=1803513 RepID=A0A8J8CEM5_9ARCH|nr:plasmid pRiA4b ORF-3 family protein [Candidatus Altarchaeum hamiconexum]OIQ05472.1 MAG: hypothetical protein AUK59_03760 [Candidatus Altarchaeum sp. CG2_30_32_3053]PIN67947.1 MAG: hypothetical protein COV98_00965 [Candidatus Altarchaeum sp. CG12_big_fil_rev_8_21_14_0_65_33_22]PIX49363.1 MAG: hypothetical protein COZ53_00900 [Candidatus Altarchaeum sp. CG_4_8_14_3_um_filter_33_2054]PIZ31921.1 MAG: hypothetical protein COY41_01855 [Candidatus Altarchaeum sp. CG_4_10_14_0_8_um_filter_32_851]